MSNMTEHPLSRPGKPHPKHWIKVPAGFVCRFLIQDYANWGVCSPLKSSKKPTEKGKKMDFETPARAWVKSLVWRLLGIAILGAISWVITHDWKEMSLITLLFHSIRMLLYYIHERLWNRVGWGRIRHPLSIFPVNQVIRPEDRETIRGQLKRLGYLD